MEESKHKSSKKDDYVKKDEEVKHKERHRDREKERNGGGDRRRDRERERERSVDEKKHKERHREKEKEKEKEKERKEREREKERERVKEKENREKERERERAKEREKEKEREREREKERERRERREREERDREKMREKRREAERDHGGNEDVKDRDRKRRRRDDDYREERERDREREREKERSTKVSSRRREDSVDKKVDENMSDKKEARTREEDMEEEQRKLDDEMEKRRRRVQEWQEKRRKKEETEGEQVGVTGETAGKTWTLDGESDDEEAGPVENDEAEMDVDEKVKGATENGDAVVKGLDNGDTVAAVPNGGDTAEDEIDPLDAYMNSMVIPEVNKLSTVEVSVVEQTSSDSKKNDKIQNNGKQLKKSTMGRIIPGEDSDSEYPAMDDEEDSLEDEDDDEFMKRVKKTKVEKLSLVDHSKINYLEFRKNFYIEVKEIQQMTSEEVSAYRKELELKIHGKDVPKPIKTWHQTGLTTRILDTIKKLKYDKPMPIQAQALPVIMSGRDCIGVAKTGSGKTLAFVLPMLRHIMDQPELEAGDGPIGLIMAPTRELVQQIHSDIRKFTKVLGLHCVPVYGGSGVAQQISELKRGAEIVVCTPGRMIDILCTSAGKITNLRRVSYLVMDEADRMFDMGFEPQITRIVQNTQPKRQTVLFSATFPRQVEVLARKVVINKPVEIQVGGRSVVNKDIAQLVEVRPENERFFRLLELLGEWYEKGKILIFVQSQEKCDSLFRDLLKHGYPCLSLHGAKDQTDRESTISDFKSNVCNLLIATSIAARGLDVKELELVINYDVPNHYEDYVHRVGRTGRAGRKGCAVTFLSSDDERYAPDLVKALELSNQVVPDDLKALADGFMAKVNQGLVQAHGTGYGGSGFKFNEEEDEVRKAAKKAQAREYGFEEDKSDSDDDDDGVRKAGGDISQQAVLAQAAALAAASQQPSTSAVPATLTGVPVVAANDGAARAAALAAAMNLQHNLARIQADSLPEHYEAELEINDFPQNARWKKTLFKKLGFSSASHSNYSQKSLNPMESDAERSIVLRDSERVIGGDRVQGTNATTAINSSGSTFKINTLSIDLGIVKGKGNAQKCSHFSIRGYVAKMREKSGYNLPFSDGNGEDLPPIEVPCFRYWLCQSCLQNCRDGSASQEVALVSEYGKSIVQPCSTSYSTLDCHHLPILPFGEGTLGLKPVDKRNDDENIPTVSQGVTAQSLPDTPTNMEEPTKTDSKATNVDAKAIDVEENVLGEVDDSNQGGMVVQSDDEHDDPSGHLRRKARKVRLLTELMCGSTPEKHQRKESNLLDSGPSPCSQGTSPQIKRKLPQAQDRRSIDVPTPGHAGKKVKVFKEGAALKTSLVEQNTDKYICKKHGTPRGSKLSKVSSDPLTAWRSIFSDMGRSDKLVSLVSVVKGTLKPTRDVSVPVSKSIPQLQPEKKSNASKKVVENPLRNQLHGKDIQRTNLGGSRVRDCDNGLGLGLSLHYDPQPEVSLGPSLPNRVPIHNHSSKAGLFYGESSITYRGVTSDPQAEDRSVYDVRDGHTPTIPLLTEQQRYHTQLSHGIFSQRQNLDFSDPHSKRNSGVRGYSDVMGAHNHQRQEISSNGRSDEKEIAELLAKIQHERNLFEAKNYCVPGGSHDSGVSGTPIFCEVNTNKGMPLTFEQYPSMRRPSSSMLVTGESLNSGPTSVTNLPGFFCPEPVPAFSKFDTFSHSQKQPSNGITIPDHGHQRLNNSYYHDFRGNDNNRIAHQSGPTNMREAFNEHHNGHHQNGTPRNLWSNISSGQNMGMHTKWSNKKGKSIINLDLNVTASNGVEEQNELNPKHMGSLGSSYSNEAIPAMQLLSLMDAGNSSSTFVMDGKKFKPKPFSSCYIHHSSNVPGKPNSYLPYSGRQSGVQKPTEDPRNLIHGTSPLSAVTNSFSSFFHTDQTVEGHTNGRQFYLKPEPKKPKGVSTGLASHKYYNPDDSFVFPLPWHTTEDRNGNVAQGALHPRNVTPGTEICTINQNPADFSTPGPGNVYMIGVEDLQFRGERCYKSQLASENIDVQKWQIRS